MSNSDWLTRSRAAVWHPCTQMQRHETLPLVPISHGKGVWLYDFEGSRYLDAVSSWWTNLFGHANPAIIGAIKEQLDRLEHVMLAGFTHAPVVELSERLSAKTSGHLGHAFYASDGASATEIALKMSFHYWRNRGEAKKTGFVSLENGYHGETVGALSVTDVALFKDTYGPLLRQTIQVMSPDWRLAEAGEGKEAYALRAAQSLEAHLAEHHETTAALILEPLVQGAAGMAMHHPAYLKRARELCDRYRVHLIADEIAVGFGRTGSFFACQQAGIWPDLICLSKGITGGYLPLSAVMVTEDIFQAFYDEDVTRGFLHSHSYTGNPLACRAALAVLDLFERGDVISSNINTSRLINAMSDEVKALHYVRDLRNAGMIWAFEVDGAAPDFSRRLFAEGLKREVLLRPMGNTVYWMPPYVISEAEARHMVRGTLEALRALA
ncbi:MAG: adenosylmethionine--8-amino-7-oxononanoate transaminase [Rhodocyclaceae bacterium]|nr:adenosylmethionine--8-amino-7-oxononanoate transaminase [Rhodocyclaceae bacterium]